MLTCPTASTPIINNYDKIYDPAKAKAKAQMEKMRNRGRDRGGDYDDEYDDYDRYDRRRRDDYYDDRRGNGNRAKSAGRDSYGGRGLRDDRRRCESSAHSFQSSTLRMTLSDSRRSYSSDSSESSISPRRAYKHRKSLGEQALAALGLGGVLGAEKEREKDRRSSRERRSDRDRAYRREDRDRGYSEGSKQLPAGYLGYNERQGYQPDRSNVGTVAKRNGYAGSQSTVSKRNGDFENARGEKRKSSSESSTDSASEIISSSEEDRRQKKMRGKEFLTAGLVSSVPSLTI